MRHGVVDSRARDGDAGIGSDRDKQVVRDWIAWITEEISMCLYSESSLSMAYEGPGQML